MNRDDDELKVEAYKKAMREFLEEQKKETFESIGKWAMTILSTALAGALLWLMLKSSGWNHE